MADLKLVGAVAIKVRPDTTKFRQETQAGVTKELRDYEAKVPVKAVFDEGKTREDAKKLEKELQRTIRWEVKLDNDSIRAAQRQFDELLNTRATREMVKPELNKADALKVRAELEALFRAVTVKVNLRLPLSEVAFVAAKLTGLRAAARWSEELGRALGTLDRNLPIVGLVTLALSELSKTIINLTADAFSLGNGLGQIVRMGGVLLPAGILALASVMTVLKGVFKDFGAAVNGDSKAMEKLTASGQAAARNMRVIFQDIRETVSQNFWKAAGDDMLEFTNVALPKVRDGLAGLSTQLGGIFGKLVDSFTTFAKQNGIEVFFSNLNRGFSLVQGGMAAFMSGFLTLASVGSTVFPRLGSAFERFADRFDAWVQRLAIDGTFNRWIDQGVEGLQNLFSAAGSLVKIWSNIGTAAQAAGALTLQSFADLMAKLAQITGGAAFQRNLQNIFNGARQGAENFRKALDIGATMDTFSVTIKKTLALSGAAFGAFGKDVEGVLSSVNLDKGITAFLTGLRTMFEQLQPAVAPISEILGTFGEVLGQVATDSGPLFRNLFEQLAAVLTTAWRALQPFLPALIQIGTSIIDTLGPAMTEIAQTLVPALASDLQQLGSSMVPIIKYVADLAVGFAQWLSSVPPSGLVAMVAGVAAVGTAFKVAGPLIKFATTQLEAFSIQAAIAAVRTQLMVPVVGLLLAGLTALTAGVVTDLALQQGDATPYANDWAQAIREDAEAAKQFGYQVKTAQIRTAVDELFSSGAVDNANALGISFQTVLDAAVKGGPAYNELTKRVADYNKENNASKAAYDKAGAGVTSYGDKLAANNVQTQANADKANALLGVVNKIGDSRKKSQAQIDAENAALKANGIFQEDNARKYDLLNQAMDKVPGSAAAAASASRTLTDAFSSGSAKIDAFRKTFDLLVGKDAKQAAAESLGAYNKGFQDLIDTVTPLKAKIQELGDAAYGDNGFLNVATGNKAVLQINQALVDQVNNTWLGAKQIYDNAIKQGKNVQQAFAEAQQFIKDHHPDFDKIAEESGLNKDKVQGQWSSVFDKEWELKVSFNGLTEVTAKVQALSNFIGLKFDGQKFTSYLELNPDEAQKALTGQADQVTIDWVNHEFRAELSILPKDVQEQLRIAVGMTNEQWTTADFTTILSVSKKVPGLPEALIALYNGTHDPDNIEAIIYANLNHISVEQARNELDELKAKRKAPIEVDVVYADETSRKLAEIEESKKRLEVPSSLQIDANTEPANTKIDTTQGKVNTLDQSKPNPMVDANTGSADAKLDVTQGKADKIDASRPNPFVDANTGSADNKLKNNLGWLGEIDRARPNSIVSATDNASGTLDNIIAKINAINGVHFAQIILDYKEANRNPALAFMQDGFSSANGNILRTLAGTNRMVKAFANGGIENHVAQIQRAGGPVRIWAEPETKAEAYIPYAQAKRPRSVRILGRVASDFGYDLVKKSNNYANGGINGTPGQTTNHRTASVHIGQLITTDPEQAVRKIRISQQDALAVAGISLNGA